ncbi:glutaredoxin [Alginatibacterium sediminis]|uniref:Glutaredoxin n=1 Tax=Alginatibacterium sediminis TaxID=2164068 RepID=A0A420EDH5_9ALTE|nr:glutathione S-transferase N-terminal domain-containing protein [Alginatibacterium sediminis]RKF18720.1 glutaredoxin [Alginatibacterium sediminis]
MNKTPTQEDSLTLYHFVGCPFCTIAISPIKKLNLNVEMRDTMQNPQYRAELVKAMGRGTVPVLKIVAKDGTEKWLPESRDIAKYLEQKYG